MMTEELEVVEITEEEREMPSLNHSIICTKLLVELSKNENYQPLVELTLDVDKGITPDISVFPKGKVKANFFEDVTKYPEMPALAIEVISASQNIQDLLAKAKLLVRSGVNTVWTVEPFTNTVFVTDKIGEKRLHNQEVESGGIKVDFRQIFSPNLN
jgi:Uma2 family endonuclease